MLAPIAFSRTHRPTSPLRGARALRGFAAATAFAVTVGIVSLGGSAAVAEEGVEPALPMAPVAVSDAVTVTKLVDTWITVTDNDSDADSIFYLDDVTQPANGQVFAIENTRFRYESDFGFSGVDTVTYRLKDVTGLYSEWVTVEITVPNAAPVAVDDQKAGAKNVQNTGNVVLNDSDPEGDALSVTWGTPSHAGFTGNPSGSWQWLLGTYGGVATVPYTLHDGYGGTDDGLLTVVVPEYGDDAPVLVADSYSVAQDNVLTVDAPGVLGNDSDPDGSPFQAMIIPQTADHGTITHSNDGSFTYTPDAGFSGTDTFIYQAIDSDLHKSAPQTVTITVLPAMPPQAFWDLYWTPTDTPLVVTGEGVLSNDADADPATAETVTDPAHGTLAFNANGTFTYQPDAGFVGSDSFQYRAVNNIGPSNTVTVYIEVGGAKPVWFTPPVAAPDSVSTLKGDDVAINVRGNDTITVPGGSTIITAAAGASHGELVSIDQWLGKITYRPDAGYAGPDQFEYAIYDSRGVMSNWATVTVSVVDNSNTAPVVTDLQLTRVKGSPLPTTGNVFDLVNDQEGNPVTITWDATPAVGTFVHDVADLGNWQWLPAPDYVGVQSIVFTATDSLGASAQGTISIAVVEDTAAPVAIDDTYSTTVGTTLVVEAASGLFANDSDQDSQWADIQVVPETTGLDGTVTVAANGSFEFTPTPGFTGTTAFHYELVDETGHHSAPAKVTISVGAPAINAAPVAATDAYVVGQDAKLTVASANGVLANDTDADGDQLTISGHSSPANGTVMVNADGSFEYAPNAGFAGTDSFEYSVTDGTATTSATVTITVTAAPAGNPGGEPAAPGTLGGEESAQSPVDPTEDAPKAADESAKDAGRTDTEAAESDGTRADAETLSAGDETASEAGTDAEAVKDEEADAVLAESKPAADASHTSTSPSGLLWLALISGILGVLAAVWITRRVRARSNAAAA